MEKQGVINENTPPDQPSATDKVASGCCGGRCHAPANPVSRNVTDHVTTRAADAVKNATTTK